MTSSSCYARTAVLNDLGDSVPEVPPKQDDGKGYSKDPRQRCSSRSSGLSRRSFCTKLSDLEYVINMDDESSHEICTVCS